MNRDSLHDWTAEEGRQFIVVVEPEIKIGVLLHKVISFMIQSTDRLLTRSAYGNTDGK